MKQKRVKNNPMYGKPHSIVIKRSDAHKIQNVKVLKGYGVSMTLKDNQILLKDGKSHFSREQEKEA